MEALPKDLLKEIFSFTPSIFHIIASVCRQWRRTINEIVSQNPETSIDAIFNDHLYHFMKSSYKLDDCPQYSVLAYTRSDNCYRYLLFKKKWCRDIPYWEYESLFLWAIRKGHMRVIEMHINKNLDLDTSYSDIMDRAIMGKQIEIIKYFLQKETIYRCHFKNYHTIKNMHLVAVYGLIQIDRFDMTEEIINSEFAIAIMIITALNYDNDLLVKILSSDFDLSLVDNNLIETAKNHYYTSAMMSAYYSQQWHIVKKLIPKIDLDLIRGKLLPFEKETFDHEIKNIEAQSI